MVSRISIAFLLSIQCLISVQATGVRFGANNTCPCKTDEILDTLKTIKMSQLVIESKISTLKEELLIKMISQDKELQKYVQTLQTDMSTVKNNLKQMTTQSMTNQNSIQSLTAYLQTKIKHTCPYGFTASKDSCYKVVTAKFGWYDAMKQCHQYGAHLATIETSEEQAFIGAMINHIALTEGLTTKQFWLGGHDRQKEGHWVWEKTGSQMLFTNWDVGQPDNWYQNDDCLEMWGDRFKWNDLTCTEKRSFICEI